VRVREKLDEESIKVKEMKKREKEIGRGRERDKE
jgi:hypothetical protein